MKIGVFCSASQKLDPDFFTMTEELGRWMGKNGHTLVFGGSNQGLMECIGKAVHAAGGQTIGVVPRILEQGAQVHADLDVTIPCDSLSERKDLMLAQSDICIALPGGIGTLDEVFTVASSHTIAYHSKMVVLYNMKGFWNRVIDMLDDLQAQGCIHGHWSEFIGVVSSLEELKSYLRDLK